MNLRNLRAWLRWLLYLIQARRWLRHNDPDRIAAGAMWHLNRVARGGGHRASCIYALKNRLVQHFYESGFCKDADRQYQRLVCRNCDGSKEDWTGDTCWKCEGTGVYRTYELIRFVFVIGGRRFVWHQPARLVTWHVWYTSQEWGDYGRQPGQGWESLDPRIAELYYIVVHEYLRQRGQLEGLYADIRPRLAQCIKDDWRAWVRGQSWYRRWRAYQRRA